MALEEEAVVAGATMSIWTVVLVSLLAGFCIVIGITVAELLVSGFTKRNPEWSSKTWDWMGKQAQRLQRSDKELTSTGENNE